MLDLQAAKKNSCGMVSTGASQVDSLLFERALGSLGASLSVGEGVVAGTRTGEETVWEMRDADRESEKKLAHSGELEKSAGRSTSEHSIAGAK